MGGGVGQLFVSAGWIKIWRQVMDTDLWLEEKFTRGQAWIDLLMLANHQDGFVRVRGVKVEVKRGQIALSEVELAKRWKWSRGKVRRFCSELESKTVQQIEQQKNNVTTLISIINYEKYQGNGTADSTADGQQTVQQTDSTISRRSKEYIGDHTEKPKKQQKRQQKQFVPPTELEVVRFFQENGYSVAIAKKAFNYYHVAEWKDSSGKPVKNWKQKMIAVWFKDENKSKNERPAQPPIEEALL